MLLPRADAQIIFTIQRIQPYTIRAMKHLLPVLSAAALAATSLSGQQPSPGAGQAPERPISANRLINAQDEPQNWLLMNGDYGSLRYSKLKGITRDNVGGLR